MLNKLLFKLTSRLPCRIIELDSGPYLERYYLGCFLGITFYLHRFVSSDSERHVHNHPWNWGASCILIGSYIEERCLDICPAVPGSGCLTQKVRRRWFNRVDGNTFHRIHDAKPGTWTLFFHGPRAMVGDWPDDMKKLGLPRMPKGWGFLERRYLPGLHEVTVFVPHGSAPYRWWEEAAKGGEINRVPLADPVEEMFSEPKLKDWVFIVVAFLGLLAYAWTDLVEWLS